MNTLTARRWLEVSATGNFVSYPRYVECAMRLPGLITRNKLATTLFLIVGMPIIILVLWTLAALNYSYSTGERAGFLQKISRRGWLCKTWEGEVQLSAIPGSMPEMFAFSVRSDSIAGELNKLNGQRVVLTYAQHKGVPTACFGETEYFITGVRPVRGP